MGFVAHSPPNFAAALSSLNEMEGPVQTELFVHLPLFAQVSIYHVLCPANFEAEV